MTSFQQHLALVAPGFRRVYDEHLHEEVGEELVGVSHYDDQHVQGRLRPLLEGPLQRHQQDSHPKRVVEVVWRTSRNPPCETTSSGARGPDHDYRRPLHWPEWVVHLYTYPWRGLSTRVVTSLKSVQDLSRVSVSCSVHSETPFVHTRNVEGGRGRTGWPYKGGDAGGVSTFSVNFFRLSVHYELCDLLF